MEKSTIIINSNSNKWNKGCPNQANCKFMRWMRILEKQKILNQGCALKDVEENLTRTLCSNMKWFAKKCFNKKDKSLTLHNKENWKK